MHSRWKQLKQITLPLLLIGVLSACSQEAMVSPQPAPPTEPNTAPLVPQPSPAETAPVYPYTGPLTGLGSNTPVESRPIMVMINNAPPARPQSGLNDADVVYEVLAEGEMTRFVAIYQSHKPPVIGPVRSIRPYYIQLGAGFDAVIFHAGGSEEALETLARSHYNSVNEITNSRYFWREKFRKMPHNLYTSPERIEMAIKDKGMRVQAEPVYLPFLPADTQITEGDPAESIQVRFHSMYQAGYEYDPQTKQYLRFTQGKPHVDLPTDKQLTATNLLVISSRHRVLDKEGRRDVDVNGPGEGYLFQQGKAKKIKWKRVNGIIRPYAVDGEQAELPLLPGNTWVLIVPDSPGLAKSVTFQ